MNRTILILISVLMAVSVLFGCTQRSSPSALDSSVPSQAASVPNQREESGAEPDPMTQDDTPSTDFTATGFGETEGNVLSFSLDLPKDWKSEPSGILDAQGRWIGSVEGLQPVADREAPFAQIDGLYPGASRSKEMTVAGYPAKCYVLERTADGSDRSEMRTQYLYYILIDDTCLFLFFSPKNTSDVTEADLDHMVSSLRLKP